MQEWINQTLESGAFSLAVLLAAFLLGLISWIACACCTLPVLGAVAGYSGTRKGNGRRATLLAALFFMAGTTIATIILGAVAGFVGQVAQSTLGKYRKLFAGLIVILFGLATAIAPTMITKIAGIWFHGRQLRPFALLRSARLFAMKIPSVLCTRVMVNVVSISPIIIQLTSYANA